MKFASNLQMIVVHYISKNKIFTVDQSRKKIKILKYKTSNKIHHTQEKTEKENSNSLLKFILSYLLTKSIKMSNKLLP